LPFLLKIGGQGSDSDEVGTFRVSEGKNNEFLQSLPRKLPKVLPRPFLNLKLEESTCKPEALNNPKSANNSQSCRAAKIKHLRKNKRCSTNL
jgi:hypothetical protein